jgi:hypothetical protein
LEIKALNVSIFCEPFIFLLQTARPLRKQSG